MTAPTLLVDVDGVLADFTGAVLDIVRNELGRSFTRDDVDQWSIRDALGLTPQQWRVVADRIAEPGFAARLAPFADAVVELRQAIADGADVYFVTSPWAGSLTWCGDRDFWLRRHFGRAQGGKVIYTAHKHLVAGDLFVDDKWSAVEAWVLAQSRRVSEGQRWGGLLWNAHHNRSEGPGGEGRVSSFAEVMELWRRSEP